MNVELQQRITYRLELAEDEMAGLRGAVEFAVEHGYDAGRLLLQELALAPRTPTVLAGAPPIRAVPSTNQPDLRNEVERAVSEASKKGK